MEAPSPPNRFRASHGNNDNCNVYCPEFLTLPSWEEIPFRSPDRISPIVYFSGGFFKGVAAEPT